MMSTLFNKVYYVSLMASALCLFACGEESDEETPSGPQEQTIMFHAISGDTHVSCGAPFALSEDADPNMYLQDLRLFVYDVELKNTAGDWVSFEMEADGEWSDGRVTLLDYEDGSQNCDESGNLLMNHQLKGMIPAGDYESIRFRVGVPFELNHQDVTAAQAPLNTSSMFWVWQRGYKFARVELLQENGDSLTPWLFHLGSTGCESEAAVIAPESPCAKMNAPWITIDSFDLSSQHLALDLRGLLSGIDLSSNTEETPVGCMSMPLESLECEPLYQNLGLDFSTGESSACEGGSCSVFRAINNDHSGDDHSGDDHSGDDHSGDDHSGDDHSGDDHSGDDHSGDDHSGDDHSGH